LLACPLVWLAFGCAALAATVAVALMVASSLATSIGLLVFARLATICGLLATAVQDVLSLLMHFLVASAVF
jgi:magnesium transporter